MSKTIWKSEKTYGACRQTGGCMKNYIIINGVVLLIGLLIIILMKDDMTILGGYIKLIGFSLTLISGFLLILSFFGLKLNRLP